METPEECAGYILEKNACTFLPHKTGRTFPDGDPKAKIPVKAMVRPNGPMCSSNVPFARGKLSSGTAPRHPPPRPLLEDKAQGCHHQ